MESHILKANNYNLVNAKHFQSDRNRNRYLKTSKALLKSQAKSDVYNDDRVYDHNVVGKNCNYFKG